MRLNIPISNRLRSSLRATAHSLPIDFWVAFIATCISVFATTFFYQQNALILYGDAESHLNIAKRVVHSLTPGVAQLGGIWLPLPHLLLVPFVYFDTLWRTGIAGAIVSGVAFIISATYLFKLTRLVTKSALAAGATALFFVTNPNILYLQSTPMTELPLIVFIILSSYFFIRFLYNQEDLRALILAAFYGFCATLSRYDGWFLVLIEAGILFLLYFPYTISWKRLTQIRRLKEIQKIIQWRSDLNSPTLKQAWSKFEGIMILFMTLAFFGIALWLGWDALILGDPLYFTHSQFSAKSQQLGWLAKGQLPAYRDLVVSFVYYFVTSLSNVGVILFVTSLVGFTMFLRDRMMPKRVLTALLLMVPFIFYVITLFMGQSIIFIPHLTPITYEWTLFNVRYGVMMVAPAAFFFGYLLTRVRWSLKLVMALLFILQFALYSVGYSQAIAYADGREGLSTAKRPDAESWIAQNYDDGLVLVDDFSRTMSIIRAGIPMQNVIYVGNKPYWEESFIEPEKYARWIITQQNDEIWEKIYEPPFMQGRLYKYFEKVYTSPEILIFKRIEDTI